MGSSSDSSSSDDERAAKRQKKERKKEKKDKSTLRSRARRHASLEHPKRLPTGAMRL